MARGRGRGGIDDEIKQLAVGCCALVLFISCFLIGFSFRIVDESEVGLLRAESAWRCSRCLAQPTVSLPVACPALLHSAHTHVPALPVSGAIESKEPYQTGRYHIGLGYIFEKFPKIYQELRFTDYATDYELDEDLPLHYPVLVRSWDGQFVTLYLRLWYVIDVHNLYDMYVVYGDAEAHQEFLIRIAKARMFEICSNIQAAQFYEDRISVEDTLLRELNGTFMEHYAEVKALSLGQVGLPPPITALISQRFVLELEIARTKLEVNLSATRAETTGLVAEQRAQTALILAGIEQENLNRRVGVERELVTVTADTEVAVARIDSDALAERLVYMFSTENMRLKLLGNLTRVRATTNQLDTKISLETDIFRAEKDAFLHVTQANTTAVRIVLDATVDAETLKLRSKALNDFFESIAADFGFTATRISELEWIAMATEQSPGVMDIETPRALRTSSF